MAKGTPLGRRGRFYEGFGVRRRQLLSGLRECGVAHVLQNLREIDRQLDSLIERYLRDMEREARDNYDEGR